MTKTKLIAVAKGVGRAVGGAALLAAAAYFTGHEAENPAIYGALIIALQDVYQSARKSGVVTSAK